MSHSPRSHVEYDDLTDLPTMMYFRRYARKYVRRAHQFGKRSYLVFFNLKNFSGYNERYGFEGGDNLLRFMSVIIRSEFPGYLLSRFSGDHFLLVCESYDVESAIMEAHHQIQCYTRGVNVELKAGIYAMDDETVDIGVACDRAKVACDSIAHRYDKVFRWFDDALNWRTERESYIESNIDKAIKKGWIKVYYQPIVRAVSGEICEFEALARWDDPRYGLLSPAIFIDVLENARLIHKLDTYVIKTACTEWQRLSSHENWRLPISVNLSRFDFELCDVFEVVQAATREYRIPHQMLHIEITESALNESAELLSSYVELFRGAGYQVWLDDFGSGYSSLNTLKDYTFDVVKIDMAFLRDFDTKPQSRVIIASVVNMAKQLGMQTLIEGVETLEQLSFVRDIGCELVQGYLISKPVPSDYNVGRILSGELVTEQAALHGYYDKIGRINSLSATPFEFPWDDDASKRRAFTEMLPLATIEIEADEVRFVTANKAFLNILEATGLGSLSDTAKRLSERTTDIERNTRETMQAAIASGCMESVDFMINGLHCVLRVRHVASHATVDALLISLTNITLLTDFDEERRVQLALRYLYAMYDEVHLIDLTMNTIGTVYRGNTSYPPVEQGTDMDTGINMWRDEYVHPADRDRYTHFMRMHTVSERMSNTDRHYLADVFRALDPSGTYIWVTILLIPIRYDKQNTILMCSRPANIDAVSTIVGEEKISKSILWDTLLDLVPAGIFWKDTNRRFVGVNKNFLDFYSFDSVNDVLGKTDEEMGWHVDEDPFKNNELRVLNGEPVLNAKGTCISQGEVCAIRASKIPLWHDGEVIGLLGYFTEASQQMSRAHSALADGFNRMAETDQLTGILNLRGFTSTAVAYQESYDENGLDFMLIVADISGMGDLNDVYGRSFGNLVLKSVAHALARAVGVSGVVARISGDKFAAMGQLDRGQGKETMVRELVSAVKQVREIAGVSLDLGCSVGVAQYSECETMAGALVLADERLQEARSER